MNYPAFEYSSLEKLKSFVSGHKVKENRYLSSPKLMSFDENPLMDDIKEECEYPCNAQTDENDSAMSEPEEKEFIDIETIYPCEVTSTTEKVMNHTI